MQAINLHEPVFGTHLCHIDVSIEQLTGISRKVRQNVAKCVQKISESRSYCAHAKEQCSFENHWNNSRCKTCETKDKGKNVNGTSDRIFVDKLSKDLFSGSEERSNVNGRCDIGAVDGRVDDG